MKLILWYTTGEYDDYYEHFNSFEAESKDAANDLLLNEFIKKEPKSKQDLSGYDEWYQYCFDFFGHTLPIKDLFFAVSDYLSGEPIYEIWTLEEFYEKHLPCKRN